MKSFISQEMKQCRDALAEFLDGLTLDLLLKRKSPFILAFMGFDCHTIENEIRGLIYTSLETRMGNILENIAIAVSGSIKSSAGGIDLELIRGLRRFLLSIKSGPRWGNSQSTAKQGDEFKKVKKVIRQNDKTCEVVSVMGICYGKGKTRSKNPADLQIEGQNLWYVLSGDLNFYKDLGQEIAKGQEGFQEKIDEATSRLCQEFDEWLGENDKWDLLFEQSCGNYDEADEWVNKLMQSAIDP